MNPYTAYAALLESQKNNDLMRRPLKALKRNPPIFLRRPISTAQIRDFAEHTADEIERRGTAAPVIAEAMAALLDGLGIPVSNMEE